MIDLVAINFFEVFLETLQNHMSFNSKDEFKAEIVAIQLRNSQAILSSTKVAQLEGNTS